MGPEPLGARPPKSLLGEPQTLGRRRQAVVSGEQVHKARGRSGLGLREKGAANVAGLIGDPPGKRLPEEPHGSKRPRPQATPR